MNFRTVRMRAIAAAAVALGTAIAVTSWVPQASAVPSAQPLSPELIAQLSQGPTQPVIVVLRDQLPSTPANRRNGAARTDATRADQGALVTEAKAAGAKNVTQFSVINGFAATMTRAESAHLAADPQVAAVVPDLPVREAPMAAAAQAAPAAPAKAPAGACPADPAKPLLEPEALQTTNAAFTDPSTPQAQSPRHRRGREGRLPRRQRRHQQPGLPPGRRQQGLQRLQGLHRRGHQRRPATAAKPSATRVPLPRKESRPTTWPISSTRRTRCPRAAPSRSRAWRPVRPWSA